MVMMRFATPSLKPQSSAINTIGLEVALAVYVDDMRAPFGRLIMCHMIADTDDELHEMADRIGVARKWWQAPPKHHSHYDIALSKKEMAIKAGAVAISQQQLAAMVRRQRKLGYLGSPDDAEDWARASFSGMQAPEKKQTAPQIGETASLFD